MANLSPQEAAKELLRRRKARQSLIAYANSIEIPGAPVSDDPDEWLFKPIETTVAKHHEIILNTLEEVANGTLKRVMLFLPPGSAKSTYASVVFPPYYLGKFPGSKIILASYGSDLAKRMGRKARQITRSKSYQPIFGTTLSSETSAADEWALTNGSEYMSGGILSGMTGNRANGLLCDDPVKGRQEADSEVIQNRTWQAYQDDLLTRLIPGGWQVIIQTRWSDNDLSGRILPKEWSGESGDIVCRDGETWHVVCVQAQCDRADDPVGRQKGEYLWPGWFSEQHFAQFKRVPRTWNALYQQIPASEEGDYFKADCCQWYDTPPKHLRLYGASDYAVTDNGGDFTEHGVFGLDPNDDLYILDWWYGQTTSDVWIEELLDLTKRHKPVTWYGESGVIKRAVEPMLMRRSRERRVYCDWQWLSSVTDKPTRARGFQARWSMGKVYLPSNAPWAARLLRQLSRFPAGAEDDGVDVCSLIGRALDDIFSAQVPQANAKGKRGDYLIPDDDDAEGWKVA
jgi:predicted phage terminase large subunit-like protein